MTIVYSSRPAYTKEIVKIKDWPINQKKVKPVKQEQVIASEVFAAFGLRMTSHDDNYAGEKYIKDQPAMTDTSYKLLTALRKQTTILQNGKLTACAIAEYISLLQASDPDGILAFSRKLDKKELLLIYNTSHYEAKEKFIRINQQTTNASVQNLTPLYGFEPCIRVHVYQTVLNEEYISYTKVYLKPLHLVILKNF